jgi:hypothetical protein
MIRIRMTGYITSAPRVTILKPCAPYVGIFLADNILNVGAAFVYIVGVEDAAKPSTNNTDFIRLFAGSLRTTSGIWGHSGWKFW